LLVALLLLAWRHTIPNLVYSILLQQIKMRKIQSMSGVGGGGAKGASAPQKVLLCQKYGQNQCKAGQKPQISGQNL